jgi:general secretion pathway protein F/type IV pilus assembly protein PilC
VPVFQYTALTAAGDQVAGSLAGVSEQAVLSELESRRLTPVAVAPTKARSLGIRRSVSRRSLAMSYQQVADLLRAGVPLLRGLKLLGNRRSDPRLGQVYRELAEAVEDGEELAEAMQRRPDVFPSVHVAMVRAGERGGFLEAVLERLSSFVMSQAELQSKMTGSLIYPLVLVTVGTTILGIIFGVFIPQFEPLFERLERLPAITSFVFAVSRMIGSYGVVTLIVVGVLVVGAWRLTKRADVQRRIVHARTWAPVIGPLTRAMASGRFCRMLGTMLGNGVPVLTAMQIAKDAAGNVLMSEAVEEAAEAIRAGEALAPPLARSGLFSDDVIEMISVGESANNLDEVLVTIANTIDSRIDRLLSGAVKLIEPLLLVAIAICILIVAAALILPMVQLSASGTL